MIKSLGLILFSIMIFLASINPISSNEISNELIGLITEQVVVHNHEDE